MCGITGGLHIPESVFRGILYAMTDRGKHATGVWTPESGVHKRAMDAFDFVSKGHYAPILAEAKAHDGKLALAIGHTRHGTHGANNADCNAHPFEVPTADGFGVIIGIHNGVIDNHKDFGPGDVDSLGLFQGLAAVGSEPSDIKAVLDKVEGYYALVWKDTRTGKLWFARSTAPTWMAIWRDGAAWASEWLPLTTALTAGGVEDYDLAETKEGRLYSLDDAGLHDIIDIDTTGSRTKWMGPGSYTHGGFASQVTFASSGNEADDAWQPCESCKDWVPTTFEDDMGDEVCAACLLACLNTLEPNERYAVAKANGESSTKKLRRTLEEALAFETEAIKVKPEGGDEKCFLCEEEAAVTMDPDFGWPLCKWCSEHKGGSVRTKSSLEASDYGGLGYMM